MSKDPQSTRAAHTGPTLPDHWEWKDDETAVRADGVARIRLKTYAPGLAGWVAQKATVRHGRKGWKALLNSSEPLKYHKHPADAVAYADVHAPLGLEMRAKYGIGAE